MSLRDDNLITYAGVNGVHEMVQKAHLEVRGTDAENPQAVFEEIVRGMSFVDFRRVNSKIFEFFKRRYNGGTQRFYESGEYALVLYRRRVVAIFPVSVLWTGVVNRTQPERPPMPKIVTQSGADVPRRASIWRAGLASQLPHRGRPTPSGQIRRT